MLLEIDLVSLREAAASVEICLETMKKHMNRSDAEMQALGLSWNGPDYEAFRAGWMNLCGPGSACFTCFRELRDFADCLHFAEEQYAKLQRDAAEQAEKLLHI